MQAVFYKEVVMAIEYTVQIWKEGEHYIAHAMPLDVMSSGKTPEEAKNAVREAVNLFIATARDIGTLNEILEECGYYVRDKETVSPSWISVEKQQVELSV